jgi:hypothetical protein
LEHFDKSKLAEAFTYWHNQAHKLATYLKVGWINIDSVFE